MDPASDQPLQDQLVTYFRTAILNGELPPDTRLPATRALADEFGISRQTAVLAYERLAAEGYLSSRSGSGTFVSSVLPEEFLHVAVGVAPLSAGNGSPSGPRRLSSRGEAIGALPVSPAKGRGARPLLAPGIPALDQFPFRLWERLTVKIWRDQPEDLLTYGTPAGHPALREALSAYLGAARGVACSPEQVIITAGSQQGVDIAARVLLDPGDMAWVEDPTYIAGRGALLAQGIRPIPVPIDEEGFDAALASRLAPSARLALVAPSHQYPLGVTMSLRRRLALLDWADRSGAWVLEDDYDSEYRYAERPLRPLYALDRTCRVIYVGTFSKVLGPGFRIGFLVVPKDLVQAFTAAQTLSMRHTPTIEQAVLAEFIAAGHFSTHIRRMRTVYSERRDALIHALDRHLGETLDYKRAPDCGLHLTGRLPAGWDDVRLHDRASRQGIHATPLTAYYLDRKAASPGLVMGFAGTPPARMEAAIAKLATVIAATPS